MPNTFGKAPLRDFMALQADTVQMMVDAQVVMTLRLLAMGGLWPASASEGERMVREKLPAFVEAGSAAVQAAIGGQPPQAVAAAWLKPIARKTRANSRRLTRGAF